MACRTIGFLSALLTLCVALSGRAKGQVVLGYQLFPGTGTTDQVTSLFWPRYNDHLHVPLPRDLQGAGHLSYRNGWLYMVEPSYYSSGLIDGGNLYAKRMNWQTRRWEVVLAGPSGYAQIPALAMRYVNGKVFPFWWPWRTRGSSGTLWGEVQLFGSASVDTGPADRLVKFNQQTGAATEVAPFGSHGGRKIQDIEGLTYNPYTDMLWGVTGFDYDGTPGDIFSISPNNGSCTYLGSLTNVNGGGSPTNEVTGISFAKGGWGFFGSFGDGNAANAGAVIYCTTAYLKFSVMGGSATGIPASDIVVSLSQ